ncbi:LPFR motif small protein [Streptomyces sp. B6B3]|uniref:LPFR motif small protein n=1 Tax=Streptomyces sp. B6B3 TaxID=3153570 RepID=UPI00325C4444
MFRAIADILRATGGLLATIVTFPFRVVARLFGGASDTAHRGRRATPRRRRV